MTSIVHVCSNHIAFYDFSPVADATAEAKLILGHFCINLNNPTTVLQQEQAKAFFANYDSKKLYSLIMDGTQISITREDYQEAKNISVEFKVKVRIIPQGKEVLNDGWESTPSLICVISSTYVKLSTKIWASNIFLLPLTTRKDSWSTLPLFLVPTRLKKDSMLWA